MSVKKVEVPEIKKEQVEVKRPLEMHKVYYGNTIKLKELPPEIDFSKPKLVQQEAKVEEQPEGPSVYELPKEIENLILAKHSSPPKERIREAKPVMQNEIKPQLVKDKAILNYGKIKNVKKPAGHGDHHDHGHHGRMREKRKLKQIDVSYHENS